VKLTEKLDSHDVGRDRGGVITALQNLQTPVLIIGIASDVLYPIQEQEELAKYIPKNVFKIIPSAEGHDGFLLEQEMVSGFIKDFIE
jgi:homoserine O-acetyltransferase/O-succinyltransferase